MRLQEAKRLREQRIMGIRTGVPTYTPTELETRGFKLKFYDLSDTKIGEIGSDVKRGRISEINFELLPIGCGAFSFVIDDFCDRFNIEYRTRVDIHPYFDTSPWFTGFIQNLPQIGQERPYEYTGFGFYEQLDWVLVTGSYESQDIANIVKDIIENTVAPNTQVVYNASKVETTGYVVDKIDFDHVYAKDAIQTLADMAQGFEFGVDNVREFYFRAIDTDINYSYWAGKHFQNIEIEKQPHVIKNKLYIKAGEIQSGGSNIIGNVSDSTSISTYGLREEVITVPEAMAPDDATQWAQQILAQKKDPKIRAKIKNIIFDKTKTKMEAAGKARVTVPLLSGINVGKNLILNPSFEIPGLGGNDIFAYWGEGTLEGSTINDETSIVHSGNHSCRFDIDSLNGLAEVGESLSLIPLKKYRAWVWYKNSTTGKTALLKICNSTDGKSLKSDGTWGAISEYITLPNVIDFAKYEIIFRIYEGAIDVFDFLLRNHEAASSSIYFDDVGLEEIETEVEYQLFIKKINYSISSAGILGDVELE
jgi:hypothetical protein